MKTQNTPTTPSDPAVPTPPVTVIGWTLLCFALVPLIMGGHGDGRTYLYVGVVMAALSLVCLTIGHFARRRSPASGS